MYILSTIYTRTIMYIVCPCSCVSVHPGRNRSLKNVWALPMMWPQFAVASVSTTFSGWWSDHRWGYHPNGRIFIADQHRLSQTGGTPLSPARFQHSQNSLGHFSWYSHSNSCGGIIWDRWNNFMHSANARNCETQRMAKLHGHCNTCYHGNT